jgi:hypothetical protein
MYNKKIDVDSQERSKASIDELIGESSFNL